MRSDGCSLLTLGGWARQRTLQRSSAVNKCGHVLLQAVPLMRELAGAASLDDESWSEVDKLHIPALAYCKRIAGDTVSQARFAQHASAVKAALTSLLDSSMAASPILRSYCMRRAESHSLLASCGMLPAIGAVAHCDGS
jgi:hypothetical protein